MHSMMAMYVYLPVSAGHCIGGSEIKNLLFIWTAVVERDMDQRYAKQFSRMLIWRRGIDTDDRSYAEFVK